MFLWKYIHFVVQPSPPSISKTWLSSVQLLSHVRLFVIPLKREGGLAGFCKLTGAGILCSCTKVWS